MEASAQARRALELDLRSATESEAFELYYQPIFNLKTRRIETCEALLRWPHHERGMVSPSEFIPVAEEMASSSRSATRRSTRHVSNAAAGGRHRGRVNLSSIQFDRSNVPALVRETLAATNLPAHRLEIEITETTLLRIRGAPRRLASARGNRREDLARRFRHRLFEPLLPAQFSVPQGQDRPIVPAGLERRTMRRITLLRGMTRLSAQLGLRVVVEGVETEEQLELLLARRGIDECRAIYCAADAGGRSAQASVRHLRVRRRKNRRGRARPQRRRLNAAMSCCNAWQGGAILRSGGVAADRAGQRRFLRRRHVVAYRSLRRSAAGIGRHNR